MSEGKVRFRRLVNLLAVAGIVWGGAAIAAPAVSLPPAPTVNAPRLYVLDCGTLVYNRPEFYNLSRDEVKDTNMPVTCYLVVHPKGTLLYDTGLSDSLVGRPLYENIQMGYAQIKFNTLRGQLADIGVGPKTIDYLVISHWHFDHTGNANDYAGAKWLGYQAERDEMFGTEARKAPTFQDYSALEHSKFQAISGEYDVFGDGTVKVIPTPGHTPGHSSLFVKLKNTGPVVLSGDLYHYEEERTLNRMPDREKTAGTPESRAAVEALVQKTGANLWVGHSMEFFKNVRKAPGWYD